eukprot:1144964-Pelagomonas_calceolata.AAC.5
MADQSKPRIGALFSACMLGLLKVTEHKGGNGVYWAIHTTNWARTVGGQSLLVREAPHLDECAQVCLANRHAPSAPAAMKLMTGRAPHQSL